MEAKITQAIFTPSSKRRSWQPRYKCLACAECEKHIGADLAAQSKRKAIALYTVAAEYALTKGIIICDTKI